MHPLRPLDRAFINRYEGGFPLIGRPFQAAAQALDSDEAALIAAVRRLLDDRALTRFGPLFDAERLGGAFTLAAMAVSEPDFARVARVLEACPEVAHNYRREHPLNMWFVLATTDAEGQAACIRRIQDATGYAVLDLPKEREYHLGFWLHLGEDGTVGTRRVERRTPVPLVPDPLDRPLVAATQGGLPLVPEPYAAVAAGLGVAPERVLARLHQLLDAGAIRRIGAVPNHYRLGLAANGMTVWDLDDAAVDALGARIGALPGVSHCYRRPRRPPLWPYNLFAMLHGRDRDQVLAGAAQIEALVAGHCRRHRVLFSAGVLKKTGLRFAA